VFRVTYYRVFFLTFFCILKKMKTNKQNKEYKIRCESECLFRMRNETTTNYKLEKADKYNKHKKKFRKNIIFFLTNCLTFLYDTFLLQFLSACSLITSTHDKDFVIEFSTERIESQLSLSYSIPNRNLFLIFGSLENFQLHNSLLVM
jgi:hypothetical protein